MMLTAVPSKTDIVQIRITLLDVQPPVWRRVLAPATLPLHRMHATIQAAMGWLDQHLYEFQAGDRRYGEADPEDGPASSVTDARTVKLSSLIEKGVDRLLYIYDFGDEWRHEIVVEDVRPGDPGVDYPCFVEGERRCPPEDCGGPPGYQSFLEAITNPTHPYHADAMEWYGDEYDPDDIERFIIDAQMSRIARARRGGLKARGRPRKAE
jgi:hypothetical protein